MSDDGAPQPAAADLLTRRAALQHVAWLLGSTLAAPTVAGVLAGCGRDAPAPAGGPNGGAPNGGAPNAAPAAPAYRLQALTAEQDRLVTAVAEQILPATGTPGARAARVNEFVDRMLAEYYPAAERERFVAGLGRLDARARHRHGRAFADCSAEQQFALVDALDAQAFGDAGGARDGGSGTLAAGGSENAPGRSTPGVAAQRDPATRNPDDLAGHSYTGAAGAASGAADDRPDPDDVGPKAFFRTMKELTLVGYYTSEAGATRELRVNPMGRYRADIPYRAVGAAWA